MFREKQYSFCVAAVDSFKMGYWEVTIGPIVYVTEWTHVGIVESRYSGSHSKHVNFGPMGSD